MGAHPAVRRDSARHDGLRVIGMVVLLLGAVGVAAWAVMALFAASSGSVAAETVAGRIVSEAVEDPVGRPDVWTATDESGAVVFEGTRAELEALHEEGRAAHQAELRQDWLYPSAGVTVVGLVLIGIGYRRRDSASAPT